jgi:hypothetical protein
MFTLFIEFSFKAKKFRRLERKTGKAIAELVKERLQGERSDDIVYVVNASVPSFSSFQ